MNVTSAVNSHAPLGLEKRFFDVIVSVNVWLMYVCHRERTWRFRSLMKILLESCAKARVSCWNSLSQ